jgi:hypothetical protein
MGTVTSRSSKVGGTRLRGARVDSLIALVKRSHSFAFVGIIGNARPGHSDEYLESLRVWLLRLRHFLLSTGEAQAPATQGTGKAESARPLERPRE